MPLAGQRPCKKATVAPALDASAAQILHPLLRVVVFKARQGSLWLEIGAANSKPQTLKVSRRAHRTGTSRNRCPHSSGRCTVSRCKLPPIVQQTGLLGSQVLCCPVRVHSRSNFLTQFSVDACRIDPKRDR